MRPVICPKCGREIRPEPGKNGYIAECCDWVYFTPQKEMPVFKDDGPEETE